MFCDIIYYLVVLRERQYLPKILKVNLTDYYDCKFRKIDPQMDNRWFWSMYLFDKEEVGD